MAGTIRLTPELIAAVAAVDAAEQRYVPGIDSSAVIELPKLALADAMLQAVRQARAERVALLPARARAVAVLPRRKRRRA